MSVTTLRTGGRLMYSGVTHGRDRVGRHSVDVLRVSMGLVILAFGLMKFFPGVSPAEDLVIATTGILTFDLVPPALALALTATLESVIGLSLVTGWGLRRVVYLLALWLAGILSPIVLLPGRLFSGPGHMPTLEGQYVLKDVILVGASIVIASTLPAPAPAHEDNTCC